jgi:hypothetical protein
VTCDAQPPRSPQGPEQSTFFTKSLAARFAENGTLADSVPEHSQAPSHSSLTRSGENVQATRSSRRFRRAPAGGARRGTLQRSIRTPELVFVPQSIIIELPDDNACPVRHISRIYPDNLRRIVSVLEGGHIRQVVALMAGCIQELRDEPPSLVIRTGATMPENQLGTAVHVTPRQSGTHQCGSVDIRRRSVRVVQSVELIAGEAGGSPVLIVTSVALP